MQLSKSGYYADFVLYPLLILGLSALQLVEARTWRPFGFLFLFLVGIAAWTLFEYLLHRYVLHRVPILHDMHEAHHADPSAFVGTPSWASFLMFAVGAFLPLSFAVGFTYASPLTIGLMFGYLCYVGVHHITHHWRLAPESPFYRFKHRHARHHFAKTPGNFGVTTIFWDMVFGTSLEAGSRRGRASLARGLDHLPR